MSELDRLKGLLKEALERDRKEQALKVLLEMARVDSDPTWPRKAAQLAKELFKPSIEVEALNLAAREYAKRGDVLLAATLCKQILEIAPEHPETIKRIAELRSSWARKPKPAAPPAAAPGPPAPAASPPPGAAPRAPGREAASSASRSGARPKAPAWGTTSLALEGLALKELIPGASQDPDGQAGVFRIPVEDAPEDMIDLGEVEQEVRAAERVSNVFARNPLFSDVSQKTFNDLLLHAKLVQLKPNQELFKEGDIGDALYVITEGTLGVVDEGPPRRGVAKLSQGDFFGEIALVTNNPRSATIVALSDAQLIAVNREVVRKLVNGDPSFLKVLIRLLRDRMVDLLVRTHPLFEQLSEPDRVALKQRVRFLEADPGAVLIAQGHRASGLLVILAGAADVVRDQAGTPVKIATLGTGDICGEMSLLMQSAAVATVRTTSKAFLIELPADAFITIVRARTEAASFVRDLIQKRNAEAQAILSGSGPYAGEGRVRPI